jgi:hypothetical protein
MAAGVVTSEGVYESPHFDPDRAALGETSNQVDVVFDHVLDPEHDKLLSAADLASGPLSKLLGRLQASGIELPGSAAAQMESAWASHLQRIGRSRPENGTEGLSQPTSSTGTTNGQEGPRPRAWLLQVFGDERSYAGNTGYDDDLRAVYHYDSFVPNHLQVKEGDLVLVRGKKELIGYSRIEQVTDSPGEKERFRCPVCRELNFTNRKVKTPAHHCVNGHDFDTPVREVVPCRKYEAHYGGSYHRALQPIEVSVLRDSIPKYARQLAIQEVDMNLLRENAPALAGLLTELISATHPVQYPVAEDAAEPNEPAAEDEKMHALRLIRARRGQAEFRNALRERYGDHCLVSGCRLLDIVEAAHINPYRSERDHHATNGLLLRADLHTLFDLDLLGIAPVTLRVSLHPAARRAGYEQFEGVVLGCGDCRPDKAALEVRWLLHQQKLTQG